MQELLIIIVGAIPIIALISAICRLVVRKKQNKSITANIIFIAVISLLFLFPAIIFLIEKDGLVFFMAIIIEYLLLSVLIPWGFLIEFVLFVVRKMRLNPSKEKTAVGIVLILLLTALVCFGTFSRVFYNAMNWIIGGPVYW